MAQGDEPTTSQAAKETPGSASKRKDVKTETVTETGDDGTTITKVITTTTEEVEEDGEPDLGGAFIDEALLKQQEEERAAVQKLIDDTIRLEMEKNKLEEQCHKLKVGLVETKSELEAEKVRSKEAQNELARMKKSGQTKGKSKKDFSGVDSNSTKEEDNNNSTKLNGIEDDNATIRNLQFRLKRLAEDDKAKDVAIEKFEKDNTQMNKYIEELEKCVPASKVEKIKKELIEKEKEEEKNKIQIKDRANIISHAGNDNHTGSNKQSTVCIVM